MKKILYIGHSYHLQTASTRFLIEILQKEFIIEELSIDPGGKLPEKAFSINASDYFAVVLLQVDYLSPIFIAQGMRTIVIPMFDGSEHMPAEHWRISGRALYLSFSRHLHAKINRAGCQSNLLKYFPEPVSEDELPDFNNLRGFVWVRRPVDGMNLDTVSKLVGDQLHSLHIHDAPDDKNLNIYQRVPNFGNASLTRSTWFAKKSEYHDVVKRCNLYFAPRMSEGIGMGFLEAMARGAVVFANNASTHNEYISNWVNGIIFDNTLSSTPYLDIRSMEKISVAAWETVRNGRDDWMKVSSKINEYIINVKQPNPIDINIKTLANNISTAYNSGFQAYCGFLERNSEIVEKIGLGRIEDSRDSSPIVVEKNVSKGAYLEENSIYFGKGQARDFLASGWSHDEDEFVWIDGKTASIVFSRDVEANKDIKSISFTVTAAPSDDSIYNIAVIVNNQFIGSHPVAADWQEITFDIPDRLLVDNNIINVFSSGSTHVGQDPRELSFAVKEIRFVE